MTCSVNIGNSSYVITVFEKGGKVLVRKGTKIVFRGQWVPPYNTLLLHNCPFKDIHSIIEKSIKECKDNANIVWPYISEKYR
jgi:hypothetical protein